MHVLKEALATAAPLIFLALVAAIVVHRAMP